MATTTKILLTDQKLAEKVDEATPRSVVVEFLEPWKMVAIRAARTYLQALVIFLPSIALGVGSTTTGVAPGDLWAALQLAAGFSLAPTLGSIINNTLDVLAGWDTSKPELRG